MNIEVIGDLFEENGHNSAAGRIYGVGGVSPTLGASNFQIAKWILVEDCYIDVYNNRVKETPVCGTLATHPQDGHSGTFYVMEKNETVDSSTKR